MTLPERSPLLPGKSKGHLPGFRGWLHADGYAGYNALWRPQQGQPAVVQHVACWAHARRYLFDEFERTKSPIAEEALQHIQAVYSIEAEINSLPPERRRAERQARSAPLLVALHNRMEAQRCRMSGKSDLGKALQYALGRWDALTRYLDDGQLSIDNNLAERLLRGIAVTRKNFLFLGSDAGDERAAIIYTIGETAKLNGHNPEAYITAVLDRLAKGHLASQIDDLLPWNLSPKPQAVGNG
jgi:hypothetical protein